jgi:hypothetical protein
VIPRNTRDLGEIDGRRRLFPSFLPTPHNISRSASTHPSQAVVQDIQSSVIQMEVTSMIPNLAVGQRLTIFTIDEILAMTHRQCVEIRRVLKPTPTGSGSRIRLGTYRERGKRKGVLP